MINNTAASGTGLSFKRMHHGVMGERRGGVERQRAAAGLESSSRQARLPHQPGPYEGHGPSRLAVPPARIRVRVSQGGSW